MFGPFAALIEILFVGGIVGCIAIGVNKYNQKRDHQNGSSARDEYCDYETTEKLPRF